MGKRLSVSQRSAGVASARHPSVAGMQPSYLSRGGWDVEILKGVLGFHTVAVMVRFFQKTKIGHLSVESMSMAESPNNGGGTTTGTKKARGVESLALICSGKRSGDQMSISPSKTKSAGPVSVTFLNV